MADKKMKTNKNKFETEYVCKCGAITVFWTDANRPPFHKCRHCKKKMIPAEEFYAKEK